MFNRYIYNLSRIAKKLGYNFDAQNDPRVIAMRNKIHGLGGIHFEIKVGADKSWTAESTNIDGIITGGKDYPNDYYDTVKDAVFTYFEIPPQLCEDMLLRLNNEPVTITQSIYV